MDWYTFALDTDKSGTWGLRRFEEALTNSKTVQEVHHTVSSTAAARRSTRPEVVVRTAVVAAAVAGAGVGARVGAGDADGGPGGHRA